MESNKLTVLENKLPLKAYPEKSLDQILHTEFMYWVSNLLSLKEDKEEAVLNAIKEVKYHFHSLGLDELKKAFEMYARGQMSIKPISNHLDNILVGQIFKEYKSISKPKNKVITMLEPTEEEKKYNEIVSATICFDFYNQNGYLNETSLYLYSVLLEKKLFNFKQSEIDTMVAQSKDNNKSIHEQRIIYKKKCLIKYFDRLIAKNQHIKDVL